jgi:hypothetical protein
MKEAVLTVERQASEDNSETLVETEPGRAFQNDTKPNS